MASAYLRYPHVHDELVVFTAADDVWLAPVGGGRAWRLTSDRAPVKQPRFSPDGAHVAFVSHRDGHPELMVVGVGSGDVRRLTYWGSPMLHNFGWTADGRVLVGSSAGEAEMRHTVTKAVALDGTAERLEIGMAWGVALHADGREALSTPGSRTPAHWKRYRGGNAPRLWLRDGAGAEWRRLLADEHASLVDPMWVGGALAFVSDRAAKLPDAAHEQANVWLWDEPGSGEPRQLTFQGEDDGYVRDATTDGARIVWHSRGRIRMLDAVGAEPRTIDIDVPGVALEPVALDPTKNLTQFAPDVGGDASVVVWRGKPFRLTHRQGPARALTGADSGVRTREPVVLGAAGRPAYVTDVDGEDAIQVDDSLPILTGQLGRVLHLAAAPKGDRLASISHDGVIRLIDIEAASAVEIARSRQGEAETPRFSPDGRYLTWSQPTTGEAELHAVWVFDTASDDEPVQVTSGRYHDRSPDFTRDGKHLVFLSDRTFDPEYSAQAFDLSFNGVTRPWLLPLSAVDPAPFGPSEDGWALSSPKTGDAEKALPGPAVSPDLDVAGAEERVVPFPVPSDAYTDLAATAGGVVWVARGTDIGRLGSRRAGVEGEKQKDRLVRWSFEEREQWTVFDGVDAYAVSGDGERIVVRAGAELKVVPSSRKADGGEDPVAVDLSRLRFQLDQAAEWHQMFDENARLMRDHFWREDMDGVSWDAVTARWRETVALVRTHDDLVDMMWEHVGELNTSHAYVSPASPPGDQSKKLGFLGADLSPSGDGWRIDRIIPGESSDPGARSPLRQAGVGAVEGDVIVEVDGAPVDPAFGPGASLIGAAGKPVELTLRRGGEDRRVVVVPLEAETALRYQDWVRSRREYVEERSGGRLGYVHVPDMAAPGWAQLHRDLRTADGKEGVVADVRYNRGGHTSPLVIERLASRVVAWVTARHYENAAGSPDLARRGPIVFVANEFSGSDGDIVNGRAQALGLGPVIGARTWGGVVGIDGRFDLVDGTGVTQPRYAFWIEGKGWGVENHGIDPDIEVIHDPAALFSLDDPQLDRAIEEALAALEAEPAAEPPEFDPPKVR
ncbi:S41 family peptidase [Microbacterium halophytorum]|uniref:S41 family peptidase n=1 Tax=Microbacterium halophytorum TaxID=2067568 RepID=UPI000CFBC6A8|nr:S41 family peptidase [Microbacterium halophytorum]